MIKRIGKKGMGLSILAGIGFLLAVCLFLVISHNARVLDKNSSNIGAIPLDVMRARYEGEKALLFLDYSAKYSLPYAVLRTGDAAGLADAPCGSYISPLWNNDVSVCPPNATGTLVQEFDLRLHTYLNQYPNIPLHSYQYGLDAKDAKLSLVGFSSEDLIIPMTKTGTGFAELADVGGGLVFPVEGNPVISSCFGDRLLRQQDGSLKPDHHDGLDFRTEQVNTKIYAIAPGQVVSVCEEWVGACDCSVAKSPKPGRACNPSAACWMKCGNLGNTVVIKHAENFYSRYSHLSSVEVQAGDQISKGMFISFSGDTGYSEAPHLDLKIYSSSDTSGNKGKNPLCIYADDQLAILTSSADSCREEMAGGKFAKVNIKEDCSRIGPEVYAQIEALGNVDVTSEKAKETTERSGHIKESVVAKVNAYQDSISTYAALWGVKEADIKAVMTHESLGDPRAGSPVGAQGLMQIMPDLHYNTCQNVCGFTSKDDFWDPDKNICCGAYILSQNWREKPKTYPACCNRVGCVREEREYVKREAMYRGYNGWGCGTWGDPNYVETVMSYYYFYGGSPSATYMPYKEQIGTYRVRPNFRAEYAYNLSVYDEVFRFVKEEVVAKSNGTMIEDFLDEQMAIFNQTHPGLVMKRYCSDYPAIYAFAEEYFDCALGNDIDCTCSVKLDPVVVAWEAELVLTNASFKLIKYGKAHPDVLMPFPRDIPFLSYGGTGKDYLLLKMDRNGGNLEGTSATEFFFDKTASGLELTRNWGTRRCDQAKEYYSLCVEDTSKIAQVSGDSFSYEPVRIKFSVYLAQKVSEPPENPPENPP